MSSSHMMDQGSLPISPAVSDGPWPSVYADQAVVGLQPVNPHALVMGVRPGHGVVHVRCVKGHVEGCSFGVRDLHGILLR